LWVGSNYLGYYNGSSWMTYMDNTGKFYLGGSNGALQWDGTSLTLSGNVSLISPTVTGGTLRTSSSGRAIVVSSSDNSLRLNNSSGQTLGYLSTSVTSYTDNSFFQLVAPSGNVAIFTMQQGTDATTNIWSVPYLNFEIYSGGAHVEWATGTDRLSWNVEYQNTLWVTKVKLDAAYDTTMVTNLNANYVNGYIINQNLRTTDSPTFAGMTLNGNINTGSSNIGVGGGRVLFPNTSSPYAGISITSSSGYALFDFPSGQGIYFRNGYGGSNVVSISSAGAIIAAGTITANGTPSDIRLKHDIKPIVSGLGVVNALNPVSFNWNEPEKHLTDHDYGFIAQEVEKILPDLVPTLSDGFKSIRERGLLPFIVAAIKEENKEIEDLKLQIKDLKEQIPILRRITYGR